MTVQIMQTAALICFLSCGVIKMHFLMGHEERVPFWLKGVEVIIVIASASVFFVAGFWHIWA